MCEESNISFHEICQKVFANNKQLHLPRRRDRDTFHQDVCDLFNEYYKALNKSIFSDEAKAIRHETRGIGDQIIGSIDVYLKGYPSRAFQKFACIMDNHYKDLLTLAWNNIDNLFRVTYVDKNIKYDRTRIFHTPYNLRGKVSTTRYSIAGLPSLYLGTSLKVCLEETVGHTSRFAIASMFKFNQSVIQEAHDSFPLIIDLAVKPQDFSMQFKNVRLDSIDTEKITDDDFCRKYLLWYPLIAACSFIRADKTEPFSEEYIIPQLLMQWIRTKIESNSKMSGQTDRLVGIRYFSCASKKASDMGLNYVFPTSMKEKDTSFCSVLDKHFILTEPSFIHEYPDITKCEKRLLNKNNENFSNLYNEKNKQAMIKKEKRKKKK